MRKFYGWHPICYLHLPLSQWHSRYTIEGDYPSSSLAWNLLWFLTLSVNIYKPTGYSSSVTGIGISLVTTSLAGCWNAPDFVCFGQLLTTMINNWGYTEDLNYLVKAKLVIFWEFCVINELLLFWIVLDTFFLKDIRCEFFLLPPARSASLVLYYFLFGFG